jgi:hypothetical protein
MKSTDFGAFIAPTMPRAQAISSSAPACAPGLSCTQALTASPHLESGTPMTAQSCTAGCRISALSTSNGKMLKPPEMIRSRLRSVM